MKFTLLVVLTICANQLFCQCIISGKITDSLCQPVADVNVVVLIRGHADILAYCITDAKGLYELECTNTKDSLLIRATIIGYAIMEKGAIAKSQTINLILTPQVTELPAVEIKREPVSKLGDTINYHVSYFANKQDRFIGDVISKIPGIDIDPSGTVKYNGKPINTYYINGLNLLEGKYSIANQNIPYDIVDRVQVFQNHQPIKILDSIENSNSPALNIELKNSTRNKFIGKVKIGTGFAPLLGENEITGLKFAKKMQFISAYKYNNTGIKFAHEITDQVSIHKSGETADDNAPENLNSVISQPQPPVQTTRYLFNNSHLFHLSTLKRLTNKAQIKLNLSYLNDMEETNGLNRSTFLLPAGNSVAITESLKNSLNTNKAAANFIYELNDRKKYLKNNLAGQAQFSNENGLIVNNGNILQQSSHPFYLLKNDFEAIVAIKNKFINIHSQTAISNDSKELNVSPGPFPSILNDSVAYQKAIQNVWIRKLSSKNGADLMIKKHDFQQHFSTGADIIIKKFESFIEKDFSQAMSKLSDSFRNEIKWSNLRLYAATSATLKMGNMRLLIELPVEWNTYSYKNTVLNFRNNADKVYFNPNIILIASLSTYYTLEMSYARQNMHGDFLQTAKGFVLNNYRNISQKDTILPFQSVDGYQFVISYKNPLNALFYNVSASYSSVEKNLLSTQIYDKFYIRSTSMTFRNNLSTLRISASANKFFLNAKVNLFGSINYSNSRSVQLLNRQLASAFSEEFSGTCKLNFDKFSFASFESTSTLNYFMSTINRKSYAGNNFSFFQFQEDIKTNFFLTKNKIVSAVITSSSFWDNLSEKRNYYFANIGFRQKFRKIELQFELRNITNVITYRTAYLLSNMQQVTETQIRPRSFFVQCYFNF